MPGAEPSRCPLLHRDARLLAVFKPAGVLSHPNPGGARAACAFEGPYDANARRFDTPAGPVWLVHRLDLDTSGVLLAAANEATAAACRRLFEERLVRKTYLALVRGQPNPPRGRWHDHLAKRTGSDCVRASVVRGRPPNAELAYATRRLLPDEGASLLEIDLVTGRTHQVRVQAAARDHPVAGDRVYGNFAWNRELRARLGLRRLFLHALRLELPHPEGGAPLRLEAPLPAELAACLAAARTPDRTERPRPKPYGPRRRR